MFIGPSTNEISRDELIDNVAVDIIGKVPDVYDMSKLHKKYDGNMTPTLVVLFQELERFNNLTTAMKITIIQLRKVIFINIIVVIIYFFVLLKYFV
jgi:dynein heavy chain